MLTDPGAGVGIGTDGDDFAAQFLKPAEDIRCGQIAAAAVNAAGVQLQTFSPLCQLAQDFVDDLPMFFIRDDPPGRMGVGFGNAYGLYRDESTHDARVA